MLALALRRLAFAAVVAVPCFLAGCQCSDKPEVGPVEGVDASLVPAAVDTRV